MNWFLYFDFFGLRWLRQSLFMCLIHTVNQQQRIISIYNRKKFNEYFCTRLIVRSIGSINYIHETCKTQVLLNNNNNNE